MQVQLLEALLYPLPIRHLVLLGEERGLGMLLRIALKDAGTDQVDRIGHGMHQSFGVVDDQLPTPDSTLEPVHEMLTGDLVGSDHGVVRRRRVWRGCTAG